MIKDDVLRRRQIRRREQRRAERRRRVKRNRLIALGSVVLMIIILIIILISSISSCVKDANTQDTSTTQETNQSDTTKSTENETQEVVNTSTVKPIQDNGEDGEFIEGVYIWNNSAFELFYGKENSAKAYADKISSYKKTLGSDYNVYNMVVPNHTEFGLPDRLTTQLQNEEETNSQRENTSDIYNNYTEDVKYIDIYNTLNEHKTEYLYFNTDHHWTGLGAYYAYVEFMNYVDKVPFDINDATKNTIDGFIGSLYTLTQDNRLVQNSDNVDYYVFPGDYTCTIPAIDDQPLSMYYDAATAGSNTYGVFLWGDNPLTVIKNNENNTGEKIAIVKESYGNAIAAYFSYNYDETHIIDFRHYEGNLKQYCEDNQIDNVLFINGVMSANTPLQLSNMDRLF